MKAETTAQVCCLGCGYIAVPTMAVFAEYNPQHQFTLCDIDQQKVDKWNSHSTGFPIFEEGLADLVVAQRKKNLSFSADIESALQQSDIVFVCVNTPSTTSGTFDLTAVSSALDSIRQFRRKPIIIVLRSTLPVGFAKDLVSSFSPAERDSISVLTQPEFLREGSALHDVRHPSRVVIGHGPQNSDTVAAQTLKRLQRHWIDEKTFYFVENTAAEIIKLAANSMLAQRLTSVNSVALLCSQLGVSTSAVLEALGQDPRIGSHYMQPSFGWGGPCLQKDTLALAAAFSASSQHYAATSFQADINSDYAHYWKQVSEMNNASVRYYRSTIIDLLQSNSRATLHCGKEKPAVIGVFGLSFKSNAGDTRCSPALALTTGLVAQGFPVVVYDPLVPQEDRSRIQQECLLASSALTHPQESLFFPLLDCGEREGGKDTEEREETGKGRGRKGGEGRREGGVDERREGKVGKTIEWETSVEAVLAQASVLVVLVAHREFACLDYPALLPQRRIALMVDGCGILSPFIRSELESAGVDVVAFI